MRLPACSIRFSSLFVGFCALILITMPGCGGSDAGPDTVVADSGPVDVVAGLDTVIVTDSVMVRDVRGDAAGDIDETVDDTDIETDTDTGTDTQTDTGSDSGEIHECVPDCTGVECGFDPICGTLDCGTCWSGSSCDELGKCVLDPMVLIPAGSFWMGCNSVVDDECESNESSYHEVTLSVYYIDKMEVTRSAYEKCVDAEACTVPSGGSNYCNWGKAGKGNNPVNCVNWDQASEYCLWAGKRLPTEAEWEKAARGTDGRKYPWGNETATCDYAVMNDGSNSGCGTSSPWDVCSKSPAGDSPYGLCDMAGNVYEWVSDWYDKDYYDVSPSVDPIGPDSGTYRITRGGSFYGDGVRASVRNLEWPDAGSGSGGFRCASDVL